MTRNGNIRTDVSHAGLHGVTNESDRHSQV